MPFLKNDQFIFLYKPRHKIHDENECSCTGVTYRRNYCLVNITNHSPVVPRQARSSQVAQQHYNLQLKKKVWFAWQSVIQKHWKVKVERACRSRAEEVCSQMSVEYEAKLAEVSTCGTVCLR